MAYVIVECPYCRASNAGAAQQQASDGSVVCRSCGRRFHVSDQAQEVATRTTQVVPGQLAADDEHARETKIVDLQRLNDDGDATSVMEGITNLGPSQMGEPTAINPLRQGPDGGGDMRTGIMSVGELDKHLDEMRASADSLTGNLAGIPSMRRMARKAQAEFHAQPRARRIGVMAGAAIVLLLVILIAVTGRSKHHGGFVAQNAPFYSAPAESAAKLGTLTRGQQLTLFDEVDNFIMVRDLQGRVGYLAISNVTDSMPAPSPDAPFADCKQAPTDKDGSACDKRAQDQWDGCDAGCEASGAPSKCNDDCRSQYKVCLAACRGEAVRPDPKPFVEPPAAAQSKGASPPASATKAHPAAKPKRTEKKKKH